MILASTAAAAAPAFDPMLIMLGVLGLGMLFFMWRGNKQRAKAQAERETQMVVGAEIMTQAGIFGTIVDIDKEHSVTTIESTPGTLLRVHSMTIANVITPTVPDDASSLMAASDGATAADASAAASAAAADDAAAISDPSLDEIAEDDELADGDEPDVDFGDRRRDGDAPSA